MKAVGQRVALALRHFGFGIAVFAWVALLSGCSQDDVPELATLTPFGEYAVPDTLSIVRPLAGGWLAQVQGGRQIVQLDSAFQIQRTIAVRGQGPGEFRQAAWISRANDTTFIWDRGGRKLLYAPDSGQTSEVDAQALSTSVSILGRANDGRFLITVGKSSDGSIHERLVQFWSPEGGFSDSIATLIQAPVISLRVQRGNSALAFMLPKQFTASDRAVLLPGGDAALLRGREAMVTCCLSTGFTSSTSIKLIGDPLVGEADRVRVIQGLPLIKDVTGDSVWPATRDALRNEDPFAGETGEIWLRLSTSGDSASTTFAVVSSGGTEPRYYTIAGADWVVLAADSVRLIAKSLDEDGVERVGYFVKK